ncbi:RidA family protein [Legionella oakridgensis]|uniref:Endoribonuclease L-PSP, putative n=2 Tax=Legionella oakridgensis TaxID=29423 RepID=W0B7B2_9GAMM|nr:RidA family protein [Legionella oakridgensis]AHE66433.1 endoribonuclease L-PSP, putative [Legionella oakridgensis ATCC 33761 = DSM 21215]KTD36872.1 endoribonuclease L-PSP [Legionella oakridgensis]STY19609.1 endoribonuclease L-PSP [Legionella longbeachae]
MQSIQSERAPAAIGTYSQAIKCGDMVYLSGQIPLDPNTMQLCSEDVQLQIVQVFDNLLAVCEAAGGSLADVVKLTVYLIDLNHFPLINETMTRYFSEPYPARAVIGVSALPRGANVEVDAIMNLSGR